MDTSFPGSLISDSMQSLKYQMIFSFSLYRESASSLFPESSRENLLSLQNPFYAVCVKSCYLCHGRSVKSFNFLKSEYYALFRAEHFRCFCENFPFF